MRRPRLLNTLGLPTHELPSEKRIDRSPTPDPLTRSEILAGIQPAGKIDPINGLPLPAPPKPKVVPVVAPVKTQVGRTHVQVNTTHYAALFYKAKGYAKVKLKLASADVVYIGTTKVSAANGSTLVQSETFTILLAPDDALYMGGVAGAPVDFVIEGIPWIDLLSQIGFSLGTAK